MSLVFKALQVGSLPAEPPEKPLNGSLVKEDVTHTHNIYTLYSVSEVNKY